MSGLTAEHIIERIANANGVEPARMRKYIEKAVENITSDTASVHYSMLKDMFQNGKPTVDELVEALEYELYDAMMPPIPGWQWDGDGYRNINLSGCKDC